MLQNLLKVFCMPSMNDIKKFYCFCLAFLFIPFSQALAKPQICKIKYWSKANDRRIIRRMNRETKFDYSSEKCKEIGNEYGSDRKPLLNKPIYACCRDPIGNEISP